MRQDVADLAQDHIAQHPRRRAHSAGVEECFRQDYRIALACAAGHDFSEGIRAAVVAKDRKPMWRPDTLEGVTPDRSSTATSDAVGALELKFAA